MIFFSLAVFKFPKVDLKLSELFKIKFIQILLYFFINIVVEELYPWNINKRVEVMKKARLSYKFLSICCTIHCL